jgi:hypothetical protein
MSIKAKLRISLHADDTVVAETDDAALWHQVLLAINKSAPVNLEEGGRRPPSDDAVSAQDDARLTVDDGLKNLAGELGLSVEVVNGACGPVLDEPFLHLDKHCWKAMKEQTPERGPTAYSGMAIATTLLALWFKAAGLGEPTQAQGQGVLTNIGLRDLNPGRGIERSEWLQARAGGIVRLHPAKRMRAIEIARAFCSQNWSKREAS